MQFRNRSNTGVVSLCWMAVFCLLSASPSTAFTIPPHTVSSASSCNRRATRQQVVLSASEGFIKTVSKPGSDKPVNLGDIATVKYTCYLPDDAKAAPFARSEKQKMVVGDGSMIKGWEKALRTMTVGERAVIRVIDPELGYGAKGVPPLIPPNAQLEFDVEILDTQLPTTNIDFDSLANADNTPRTASDIQAAYEQRQALRALDAPAREGFEGFLDKAKNFYFFGFFEGETGEKAPWILRPSITFPIAFLVVGAAFYISIISGAISERGASVTDELDEVILSSIMNGSFSSSSSSAMVAVLFSSFGWNL